MPFVTTKDMFEKSMKEKFAIGAFNINNMEFVQAIMDAAAKENSPVILQTSASAIKYARVPYLKKMIEAGLEEHDIPVALHLDHGPDFETCKMCVDNGYTSVMFDGSKYDFETNIKLTKEVVDYAHAHGVVVEAELGKLAGIEDDVNVSAEDAMYTDPDEAKEFVERTGCDSLAIAIGTSHGAYKFKGEAKLRFAKIIDDSEIDTKKVQVGNTVKVLDMEFDEEVEYTIVGTTEADITQNKISNESPIGSALLGAKKNQIVEVQVPAGVSKYKILSITKA